MAGLGLVEGTNRVSLRNADVERPELAKGTCQTSFRDVKVTELEFAGKCRPNGPMDMEIVDSALFRGFLTGVLPDLDMTVLEIEKSLCMQ